MNIHEGDTVKVVNPLTLHSGVEGRTGKVLFVSETKQTCSVQLGWEAPVGSEWGRQGVLSSFFFTELEVTDSHEIRQIRGIADVLHKSGRYDDIPWVEIKADAESLYKAGCRFDG